MSTLPPNTRTLADSLTGETGLASLLDRARRAQAMRAALAGVVPAAMLAVLQASPGERDGLVLSVPSGAAAAKLRQLLPLLQRHLANAGWPQTVITVRVATRAG